jgi:hypothetical protein
MATGAEHHEQKMAERRLEKEVKSSGFLFNVLLLLNLNL